MYLADGAAVRNVHTCQPSMSLSTTDSPNVASRGGIVVGNVARDGLSRCPPNRFPIAFCSRKLATIARVTIVGAPVNVAGADAAGLGLVVNARPLTGDAFSQLAEARRGVRLRSNALGCVCRSLSYEGGQRFPASSGGGVGKFGVVDVDVPDGEAFEDLFKRDLAFETGQGGTQAEVHTVSEAHDLVGFAMHVGRGTGGANGL